MTEPRPAQQPQPALPGPGPSHTTPPASFVRGLDIELEVGGAERHHVHFHWNQSCGISEIDVDGRKVIRKVRPFEVAITRRYRFTVGERERHEVLIEKKRPLLYAGFRPQVVRVFPKTSPGQATWHQSLKLLVSAFANGQLERRMSMAVRWLEHAP